MSGGQLREMNRLASPRPSRLDCVERAAMGIKDADGAIDDKAVKVVGAQIGGKRLAQAMQEIEDAGFLEFNLLPGALGLDEVAPQGAVLRRQNTAAAANP